MLRRELKQGKRIFRAVSLTELREPYSQEFRQEARNFSI